MKDLWMKDYDNSNILVRYLDESASKIFGSYLVVAGFVGPALVMLLNHSTPRISMLGTEIITKPVNIISTLLIFVGCLAGPVILQMARLRAFQADQLTFSRVLRERIRAAEKATNDHQNSLDPDIGRFFAGLGTPIAAIVGLLGGFYLSLGVYFLVAKGMGYMHSGQFSATWGGLWYLAIMGVTYRQESQRQDSQNARKI